MKPKIAPVIEDYIFMVSVITTSSIWLFILGSTIEKVTG